MRIAPLHALMLIAVLARPALAEAPALRYYARTAGRPKVERLRTEVCVYGATASGIVAAVQLSHLGRRVILLEPSHHLGGMTAGGLSATDIGNKAAIGGLSRDFYRRLGAHYGEPEEWRFEPHVATEVLHAMVAEARIPVFFGQFLKAADRTGNRITAVRTEAGLTIEADAFIDTSYEGDLMARAGVRYHWGREANSVYGETLNGVQVRDKHQFLFPVDPWITPGDPKSGLLPIIDGREIEPAGAGDRRVQAYNFRMCLTTKPENRLPFPRPDGYDPAQQELLARYLQAGWRSVFTMVEPLKGDKVDMNNNGAVASDYIGRSHRWPVASYPEREEIFQDHVRYQQGMMWFLANDPRVPEVVREQAARWGLSRDEFPATGGWPHQLYIREARRMIGAYVMTEHNCRGARVAEDPIGLAAYTMDSHNCRRFLRNGVVMNDGDVQVGGMPPYPISYRSIVPRASECANLLVPVCLSSSHIAYGSIRMEPVFMILGQSAAVAAHLSIENRVPVQDVPYPELRAELERLGQILEWKPNVR